MYKDFIILTEGTKASVTNREDGSEISEFSSGGVEKLRLLPVIVRKGYKYISVTLNVRYLFKA